jgi:hypothetical protein
MVGGVDRSGVMRPDKGEIKTGKEEHREAIFDLVVDA